MVTSHRESECGEHKTLFVAFGINAPFGGSDEATLVEASEVIAGNYLALGANRGRIQCDPEIV